MNIETTFPRITRLHNPTVPAILLVLGLLLTPDGVAASGGGQGGGGTQVPYIQRAMEANAQMKALRERTRMEKSAAGMLSSVGRGVEVRLNTAAGTSSTIFFYDNMEAGANGWTTVAYSDADLWHQTTLDASSPSHSWWPGNDLLGTYGTGARVNGAALTPAIDLSAAVAPLTLLFAENFYTERGWDYCMVDVTTDGGGSWTPLRGVYGTAPSGDTEGWRITTLDLSAFAGATINVRFYFDTGDSLFNAFPGWFVDDVMIFDQGGLITGRKFFDVNNNGVKELHERGIADWPVTAAGPVSLTTRTNYRGRYDLVLPLGNYTVSEAPQAGWTQTYPPGGTYAVSMVTADTVIDSIHFGNWRPASFITGVKFHDLNRNGFQDGGDTLLPEWKMTLTDTNGVRIRFDRTDSLGVYSIPVYEPGLYRVYEADRTFWVQTYPPTEYWTVFVPDVVSTLTGKDFGNYYSDSVNSIFGKKFNDLNRNGVYDLHEPGIPDWELYLGGTKSRYRRTDDSGYFSFTGLPQGPYYVKEIGQDGWWPSLPPLPDTAYNLFLSGGTYVDSVNFGNYEIAPGGIGGTKWNDLDGNGLKDPGEPGIPNWKINLTGKATASVYTDLNGDYLFTGLWPGQYTVSESWRPFWRPTYPPNLGTHAVGLGPEQVLSGYHFGNTADSSFSTTFRTFTYDSLALGKDKKNKTKPAKAIPDKVEFSLLFVNDEPMSVGGLTIRLTNALLDSLTYSRPGIGMIGGYNKLASFTLTTPMAVGETLIVSGFGKKAAPQNVRKWWWTRSNLTTGTVHYGGTFLMNILRFPMPNTINLIEKVGGGLRIGMGGPHSVVHLNYKAVLKSLIERGFRLHLGLPRCLDRLEGIAQRPISRERRYLMPKQHNNVLFAEAITLKVNIRGSDNLNLPPGFGDLIYDEGTGPAMPLNGLSIREIAGLLDKYMSSFSDTAFNPSCSMIPEWAGLDADTLWDRIRRINGSFSGPIDTVSFHGTLMFTGVGSIGDVSYLRLDTSTAARPRAGREEILGDVPDEFELSQNYPNPFNPLTTIEYYLPEDSRVSIVVYNTLGQVMERLVDNEEREAGYDEVAFDASAYSSGVYFYRLAATTLPDPAEGGAPRSFATVRKMVLMR